MSDSLDLIVPLPDALGRDGLGPEGWSWASAAEQRAGRSGSLGAAGDVAAGLPLHLVPGCSAVTVCLNRRHRPHVLAATSPMAHRLTTAESAAGEGPGLDAARDGTAVLCTQDTAARWPRWAPRMRSSAVPSALCLPLLGLDGTFGTVTLLGESEDAFGRAAGRAAAAAASVVGRIVAAARNRDNYERAVASRTAVGQAQGILMVQLGLDAAGAFDVLRRMSQHGNVRLSDVADGIVAHRGLPTTARSTRGA